MDTFARLAEAVRAGTPVGVATVVSGIAAPGAKMLVFGDGTRVGSLELGGIDEQVVADVREALRTARAETRRYAQEGLEGAGAIEVFIESHVPKPELVIVGAGHTSIPLSAYGRIAGFRVVLIDARAAFASRERFPDVDDIVVAWPHEALAGERITASTYVAVLTHDAKFEVPLLPILLRSPARYIGVIGSRKTQIARRERLRQEGFGDADIARLNGPIGLDIGAVTPEEIALSVIAEIVAKQHGRSGGSLSDTLLAPAR